LWGAPPTEKNPVGAPSFSARSGSGEKPSPDLRGLRSFFSLNIGPMGRLKIIPPPPLPGGLLFFKESCDDASFPPTRGGFFYLFLC